MKKWLLLSGVIVLIVGSYLLFFTPVRSLTCFAHRTIAGADRCFADTARWSKWWPESVGRYQLEALRYNDARIAIRYPDGGKISGDLRLAPWNADSILISWEGDRSIRGRGIDVILDAFRRYVENPKNIYGVEFYRTMSNDSALVTMTFYASVYPGVGEVYSRIDSLRSYIASQGAKAINQPMLNVTREKDSLYRVSVAISVDRRLAGKGRIQPKRFVPYKMLEGEVHGGASTVEKAFDQMQKFKIDYNIQIMALPFQSLITDRRQEPDTTKWVTKVCAPIS
jgi:hypothetical protein